MYHSLGGSKIKQDLVEFGDPPKNWDTMLGAGPGWDMYTEAPKILNFWVHGSNFHMIFVFLH